MNNLKNECCSKCGKKSNVAMSLFDVQFICEDCIKKEREILDYKKKIESENKSIKKAVYKNKRW